MKKTFAEMLKSSVIIESKQVKKIRKQQRQKRVWPEDFVKPGKNLSEILDAKLSLWHDDDWDEGKGDEPL
jgi:hypothetical protein